MLVTAGMLPGEREDTADCHASNYNTVNSNSSSLLRFHELTEAADWRHHGTRHECTKLVYHLSREVAIYCGLSMAVGGVSDSYVLRDELRAASSKVFDMVLLCKRKLMPLILSKRMKTEERDELERLYRIFVGCLEMLQTEFIRAMSLQSMFPLWDSNTLLIQTGVNEYFYQKKSAQSQDGTGLERKMADHEEFSNLERKLTTIQEMCYSSSQLMDVHPWDYRPDSDHTKIDLGTPDTEREITEITRNRLLTTSPHHRRRVRTVVTLLVVIFLLAGVVGLTLALSQQ